METQEGWKDVQLEEAMTYLRAKPLAKRLDASEELRKMTGAFGPVSLIEILKEEGWSSSEAREYA